MRKPILLGISLLALAGALMVSGGKPMEILTPSASAAPSVAKPAAFAQCAICHRVDKSRSKGIGPNLFGVYGKKAGSTPGYTFSPAMKAWGKTLNDATLDAYLENPRKAVPGNRMAYAGLKDPAKRKAIINWLKTQK